ncbi:transposase [Chromobacterium amazonense]|uniref:transposase n=1 Tax=Chromobacterium amazonense TaxID=1382803 RepID=UPI003B969A14
MTGARFLDSVYPILYPCETAREFVRVKAVYLAIGVTLAGEKEVLGMWLPQSGEPSSDFW